MFSINILIRYCKKKLNLITKKIRGRKMKNDEKNKEKAILDLRDTVLETVATLAKLDGLDDLANSLKVVTEFRNTLSNESDRGATLMAAAFIDDRLAELIKKYLIKDRRALLNSLFNFNGALGTFSSRTSLAYCLGLIPEDIYDDINYLRKIRNIFAHSSDLLTFDSDEINSVCHKFKSHTLRKEKSAKSKFMRTMMSIISVVEPSMRKDIEECKKMDNLNLEHHHASAELLKKHLEEKGFDLTGID